MPFSKPAKGLEGEIEKRKQIKEKKPKIAVSSTRSFVRNEVVLIKKTLQIKKLFIIHNDIYMNDLIWLCLRCLIVNLMCIRLKASQSYICTVHMLSHCSLSRNIVFAT
jgi:hypothetical protein